MGRKKLNFDRTLVLRICDERLQARIHEKMAAVEEEANKEASNKLQQQQRGGAGGGGSGGSGSTAGLSNHHFAQHRLGAHSSNTPGGGTQKQESKLFDLAGVTIEPAIITNGSSSSSDSDPTRWNFICDGATYPARLTNLPCPVELHKTHDHAMYYKCVDIAQMLIVYEDTTALEEAESMPGYKVDGFPSYYHSGLTPPTSRIVSKRFKERFEHRAIRVIPPPYNEIQQVEKEIIDLMNSISTKDAGGKSKKNPKPALNKVLEEVEEVVVQYEPWMDDYGRKPDGIEFEENSEICRVHPEVWLDPSEIESEQNKNAMDSSSSLSSSKNQMRAKSKTPTSMSSPNTKQGKSSTPDAPTLPTAGTSTTSKTKKKKEKSAKEKKPRKKKEKKKIKSSTPPIPTAESFTPVPDAVDDLDAIPLEMNALDDLDDLDNLGLEGLDGGLMDDDLLFN